MRGKEEYDQVGQKEVMYESLFIENETSGGRFCVWCESAA